MSLGKVARKLKRVGKEAVQFRFTSTFEYIELKCNGTWRPDNLRVIWLRSHRRVQSIDVQWEPTEDRGPNGAEGKATFNPPLSVALIVTLYRDTKNVAEFEPKEYKYYIENDGQGGKKILASFNCDMAEYVGIPSSKSTLDMTFKSVSRKVGKAILGITLESQFIKQGNSLDDDMQSTFSSMDAGRDSMAFDDEDDDEEAGAHAARPPPSPQLSKVTEEVEPTAESLRESSLVTLGTGQTYKRQTLPRRAPNKPPRTQSLHRAKKSRGKKQSEKRLTQIPKISITRDDGMVVEPLLSPDVPPDWGDHAQAVSKSESQTAPPVAKSSQAPIAPNTGSNETQVAVASKSVDTQSAPIAPSDQEQSALKSASNQAPPSSKAKVNQVQAIATPGVESNRAQVDMESESANPRIAPVAHAQTASQTPPTPKDNRTQVAVEPVSVQAAEASQSCTTTNADSNQAQGALTSKPSQSQVTVIAESNQVPVESESDLAPSALKTKSQTTSVSEAAASTQLQRQSESSQSPTVLQHQVPRKLGADALEAKGDATVTSSASRAGKENTAALKQQQPSEGTTAETKTRAEGKFPSSPADQTVAVATPDETTRHPECAGTGTGTGPAQVPKSNVTNSPKRSSILKKTKSHSPLQSQKVEHTEAAVADEQATSADGGKEFPSKSIELIQKGTVHGVIGKFEAPVPPSSSAKGHQEPPSKEQLKEPPEQEQPPVEKAPKQEQPVTEEPVPPPPSSAAKTDQEPPNEDQLKKQEQPPVEKALKQEQPVTEEPVPPPPSSTAKTDQEPPNEDQLKKQEEPPVKKEEEPAKEERAPVEDVRRKEEPPVDAEVQSSEATLEKKSEHLVPAKPPRKNSSKKRKGEKMEVEQNGDLGGEHESNVQSTPPGNTFDAFDFVFETSKLIASQMKQGQAQEQPTPTTNGEPPLSRKRTTIQSKEEYIPPPNPFLVDEGAAEEVEPPSPTAAWLGDAAFIDCFGEPVGREKLDNAEIIGLYFSANWCPPCRRFLPKLVKFYHHLKQHNKSFEILYISSDYSKQEMLRYMEEQQMPWVGLAFDSSIADKLRADFSVSAIPLFTVVSTGGIKLEESAKKSVEAATSSSGVLKLYNKWYEKLQSGGVDSSTEEKQKKGLFKKVKDAVKSPSKDETVELESQASPTLESQEAAATRNRQIVDDRSRTKSKKGTSSSLLEEREERIHYLEEVNMSLKQTNDDLNEEVAEIRRQLTEAQQKLGTLEESSRRLEDEKRELMANLNIRGWLFKRGLKGPTANVWRRRYFRCDQGSKIYYYKSATEGQPQGFIDLDKVISCQEVSAAQQDKNHATFLVQCDGRTYQLQAHDEATMRKWMGAIEYMRAWRKRQGTVSAGAI